MSKTMEEGVGRKATEVELGLGGLKNSEELRRASFLDRVT